MNSISTTTTTTTSSATSSANLLAAAILEARAAAAEAHAAARVRLEEGVANALLGRGGWVIEVGAGDSNGRLLGLSLTGEHVATFFGRYHTGNAVGSPTAYGVTRESEFRDTLHKNPAPGVTYKWETKARGIGADMKWGIPYSSWKITVISQEVSASSEEAAKAFAERLVSFEVEGWEQDHRWAVEKCHCYGRGFCPRCKLLAEEAILQAG
jgi:hypothetical protein